MKAKTWKAHGKEGVATVNAKVQNDAALKAAQRLSIPQLRDNIYAPALDEDGFIITHVGIDHRNR